jgi:hypothetical protein
MLLMCACLVIVAIYFERLLYMLQLCELVVGKAFESSQSLCDVYRIRAEELSHGLDLISCVNGTCCEECLGRRKMNLLAAIKCVFPKGQTRLLEVIQI